MSSYYCQFMAPNNLTYKETDWLKGDLSHSRTELRERGFRKRIEFALDQGLYFGFWWISISTAWSNGRHCDLLMVSSLWSWGFKREKQANFMHVISFMTNGSVLIVCCSEYRIDSYWNSARTLRMVWSESWADRIWSTAPASTVKASLHCRGRILQFTASRLYASNITPRQWLMLGLVVLKICGCNVNINIARQITR